MIYLNKEGHLVEKVRRIASDKWEDAPKPPGHAAENSRITSGVSQRGIERESSQGTQLVFFVRWGLCHILSIVLPVLME